MISDPQLTHRKLGPTEMSWTTVGLGTWNMERDPKASVKALLAGLDEGANNIDTAEMYGDGRVEEIVGEALRGRRDQVYVVSKVLPSNSTYQLTLDACRRSLRRLKTDYLDLYLLHWRNKRVPLGETFRAFEDLKKSGEIRHWGVSNFNVADMEEAADVAGKERIACNQVLYHLEERAIEDRLIPWCRRHGIAVVAYSPFGQKALPENPVLDDLAHKHNASPSQIMLSFLTRDPDVFAIPKSSDVSRTRSNVRSMKVRLSEDDYRRLSEVFPMKSRRGLPML